MQSQDGSQPDLRRIALVTPGWPADAMANGIASYVATVARGLEALGVRCDIFTPQLLRESSDASVHLVGPDTHSLLAKLMWRIDPAGWSHRSFSAALRKQIQRLHRDQGLQLLEMEESYGWARHLAGRLPVPIVLRLHGPWFLNGIANGVAQDAAFRQRDAWEKAGILAADAITAPSQDVLEQTRAHYGLSLPDARVLPNPVEPVGSNGRWNLQDCDRNRIVFVGRFDRHKGGDTMIDAFAAVESQFPDARLDFIGPDRGYRDDSGRERKIDEYLRSRLSDTAREKVTFHGFLPGPAAAALRKRALVTVAPSRYETFGIATAEAMMAGCPVVVCGAGALNELVQDGHNGRVARPGDPASVADCVLSLLKDPEQAAGLGRQAALDAMRRYAPDVVAAQTAEFYQWVLHRSTDPNRDRTKNLVSGPQRPASVSA